MVLRNIFFFFFLILSSSLYGQGSIYKKANKALILVSFIKQESCIKKHIHVLMKEKRKQKLVLRWLNCAMLMGDYKLAESYYKRTIKLRYIEMFAIL